MKTNPVIERNTMRLVRRLIRRFCQPLRPADVRRYLLAQSDSPAGDALRKTALHQTKSPAE